MQTHWTPDEPVCPACNSSVSLAGEEVPPAWEDIPDASINLTCDRCGEHLHIEARVTFETRSTTSL